MLQAICLNKINTDTNIVYIQTYLHEVIESTKLTHRSEQNLLKAKTVLNVSMKSFNASSE